MASTRGADDLEKQAEKQSLTSTNVVQNYASITTGQESSRSLRSDGDSIDDSDIDDEGHREEGDGTDIVQLSAPMYYVAEDQGFAKVEVIRLGSHNGVVSVMFNTKGGSAKPGINFTPTQKEVVFGAGQSTKVVDIPILADGKWTPSFEFSACLEKPQGCLLGMSLSAARVKILNSDPFPSDEYRNMVTDDGTVKDIDLWRLYWNYTEFNFRYGGVGWQSILSMCLDQLTNICLFVSLCVAVYMVDVLFDRGVRTREHLMTKDRYHDAVLIGLWYCIPAVLLFFRDVYKARLDIEGTTTTFLRRCMMINYLQYTEDSRVHVGASDLNIAICENAGYVSRGYIAGISIFQSIGKIFAVLLFMCLYQPHIQAICMVALMPILLLLFVAARLGASLRAEQEAGRTIREVVFLTQEACLKYKLIADYVKRYIVADKFIHAAKEDETALESLAFVKLVTAYITKFITGFFICAYIILNAQDVLEGQLSLGLFLATITTFATYLADAAMELNHNLGVIMESFLSLKQTTLQLNLPLEHDALKAMADYRRRKTLVERRRQKGGSSLEPFKTDLIEIRLKNVSLAHVYKGGSAKTKFENVNLAAQQGAMIAIVGPESSCKKTILDVLADRIFPKAGHVFVPSHLRVLHVSREPMFLSMSLLHNLTLGLPSHHKIDIGRVQIILRYMNIPDAAEQITQECGDLAEFSSPRVDEHLAKLDMHDNNWLTRFSHTQQTKLHISRALIADPNVMILQRPLCHFSEAKGDAILKVFRMHLESRGLGYAEDKSARRPRTMFLIPETTSQANAADVIWSMDPESKSVDTSFPSKG